jgi:hypothetical protein
MASDASVLTFADRDALCARLRRAVRLPADEYRRMSASATADGQRLDWDAHVATVVDTYEALRAGRPS